ncbi:MAG: hypothetical protein AAGA30_01035 [Planctomycetota bacterium]
MRFSVQNVLLSIGVLAGWLGLILSDSNIQRKAVKRARDQKLIEAARLHHLPITQQEIHAAMEAIQRTGQIAKN